MQRISIGLRRPTMLVQNSSLLITCMLDAPLRFTYESLTGTFLATPRAERALVIG